MGILSQKKSACDWMITSNKLKRKRKNIGEELMKNFKKSM